jgi:hypothetical protein
MLGNSHFYNRTIRKIVVAFGSMFNDITLVRYNKDGTTPKESFKVPLSYGPKEKYLTKLTSDPDLIKSVNVVVPRISFELVSMEYDPTRKLLTTNQHFAKESASSLKTQYSPVPYNFEFNLSVYVRNTEDGTQIIEQILPFFTPDFIVTVDLISSMNKKYDIPILLNSVTTNVEYEGDTYSTRLITWDMSFTVKGYIFPPVKTGSKVIGGYNANTGTYGSANTNIYVDTRSRDAQKVYVWFANGNGVFTTGETIRVNKRNVFGEMVYFSNSNNGVLVAGGLNKLLEVGDKVTGDYSNASFVIKTVDNAPIKALAVVTQVDPLTAEIDDEFGFSETITNWPYT